MKNETRYMKEEDKKDNEQMEISQNEKEEEEK